MNLIDLSIKQYSELLGSDEPAPGGGSASALAGVLAASLTAMVVNLSIGKEIFEALDENIKSKFMGEYKKIKDLREDLYKLIDEDAIAFKSFMSAMRLAKNTEEEKTIRRDKMQEASIYMMKIPLNTAEKCYQILKNQKNIALYGNKNAISDVGVGCFFAKAGLEGALLNVNINLPFIKDENIKIETIDKSNKIKEEGMILYKEIIEIVEKRVG